MLCGIKALLLTAQLPSVELQLHPGHSVSYASAVLLGATFCAPDAKKIYFSRGGNMLHCLPFIFLHTMNSIFSARCTGFLNDTIWYLIAEIRVA